MVGTGDLMERRLYFVFGDLLSNAAGGAVAAAGVALLVGAGWPLPIGMIVGMAAGGLAAMLLASISGLLFGVLELMLPMMTTGMAAGMLAAMDASSGTVHVGAAAARGAVVGAVVLGATYVFNGYLQRRGSRWTS